MSNPRITGRLFFFLLLLSAGLWLQPDSRQILRPDDRRYPNEWMLLQRLYPYGTADRSAYLEAVAEARQQRKRLLKTTHAVPAWEFVGPANIGGRISALAISPLNPDIVFAGAATGGVFKSTDGGKSWVPVFDDQAVLPIGDVAIDPNNPDVVYAGTGEANGGHNNFPGAGLFKSTDGGLTWQHMGLTETTSIARILVDPNNSDRVYVAAIGAYFGPDEHRGLYRSNNGGQTWEKVLFFNDSTGVIDLVMHPQQTNILFAAVWERIRPVTGPVFFSGPNTGIYKSMDSGNSWQRLGEANGLPGPDAKAGRIGLAICRDQPDHLYALYTDGFFYMGLYRSKDGGQTWTQTDPDRLLQSGNGGFSWYFGQVRVHPSDPERVFVLDVALMGSNDGGVTWPIVKHSAPGDPHVDHHALVFHPQNPEKFIDGNDGGIYLSENGGQSWQKVSNLPITQFYHIEIDPTHPERAMGGTQDNGTIRTLTGDAHDWQQMLGGDGFYAIVDPTNPNILYAEAQFGNLVKSTDGGQTWRTILRGIDGREPRNWSTPVIMAPHDPRVLYYGTHSVYKTWSGGELWHKISPKLTSTPNGSRLGTITTIAPAPSDTAVIYVGLDDGHVWVTDDGGANWRDISEGLPVRWVTRLRVDPRDAGTAYITFSGLKWNSPQPHVFRTDDMGASWIDISAGLPDAPVNSLILNPADRRVLFVATDVGVYHSIDRGKTWQPTGEGMPVVSVYDFAIDGRNHMLYAGTHGRSMYRLPIDQITAIRQESPTAQPVSFALAQNYPNPFNDGTRIRFTLSAAVPVTLEIYDIRAMKIATLVEATYSAGEHVVQWDGRDSEGRPVASGIYLYRLRLPLGESIQKRMVVVR